MERDAALHEIERLKRVAEEAYDKMYDAHEQHEARFCHEIAWECLKDAEKLALELGLAAEAEALSRRATHIRTVYRHQFMMPPDMR